MRLTNLQREGLVLDANKGCNSMEKVQMPRVLFVSYYYPPGNTVAATRISKLTKYLSEFGFEVWVLTIEEGLFPSAGKLPIEIPSERIVRADLGRIVTHIARRKQEVEGGLQKSSEGSVPVTQDNRSVYSKSARYLWKPFSALFTDLRFPDRALPWVRPAIRKGNLLLHEYRFDAIISSHGPPSSHFVAASLSKRFGLPWIADFRDLWTQNHIIKRHGIVQYLEEKLEKRMLKTASHLVTISAPLAKKLYELHGKTVTVIPNGFDESDYLPLYSPAADKIFRIVYTGMIYRGKQNPTPFLEALRILRARWPDKWRTIEVHFFGSDPSLVMDLAASLGVNDRISVHPRVSNSDAIRWQKSADLLLLLAWDDPRETGVYTGKVFEYLGAQRPILAIGPCGGVIEELLRTTGRGQLSQDPEKVVELINKWWAIKDQRGTTIQSEDKEALKPYTRRYQASVLGDILRSIGSCYQAP